LRTFKFYPYHINLTQQLLTPSAIL